MNRKPHSALSLLVGLSLLTIEMVADDAVWQGGGGKTLFYRWLFMCGTRQDSDCPCSKRR